MNSINFLIMIAVLCWNIFGILQTGIAQASAVQWILTGLMFGFVVRGIIQRTS